LQLETETVQLHANWKTMDDMTCETDGLEWKTEGVSDKQAVKVKTGTVMKWYVQDVVNQEESEQDEVDGMKKEADSTDKMTHVKRSRWWFVISESSINNNYDGWEQVLQSTYRKPSLKQQLQWTDNWHSSSLHQSNTKMNPQNDRIKLIPSAAACELFQADDMPTWNHDPIGTRSELHLLPPSLSLQHNGIINHMSQMKKVKGHLHFTELYIIKESTVYLLLIQTL